MLLCMSILKKLREQAGLSQAALADKLGWNQVDVHRLETGKVGMTLDKVKKLSKALGVPASAFVEDVAIVRPPLRYPGAPSAADAPIAHSLYEITADAGGKLKMAEFLQLMAMIYNWAATQEAMGRKVTAAQAKKQVEAFKRLHFPDKSKQELRERNRKKR
ncbi:MAG: helix-turn-helix domain-containing protein [Alphaproteobacteria bacterium]|nr:helix-turn-helix domain-containing protein [Alphaproteobacteria bacterium]